MEHEVNISEISLRRGNIPLEMEIVRELLPEDIVLRGALGAKSAIPSLKSLRATHHKLAQLIASGVREGDASIQTGYSISRISILKNDPAFKELLAHYMATDKEVFVDVQQRMAGFAVDCLDELQERLETKPETLTTKDLTALIKTTADRGGHSPVHKTENKTIVLTAQELLKLKEEVQLSQNGQVRKINQAEESLRVRQKLEGNSGPEIGSNDNGPSGDFNEAPEASRIAGEGPDL